LFYPVFLEGTTYAEGNEIAIIQCIMPAGTKEIRIAEICRPFILIAKTNTQ
jgi:hypothetical protein